MKPTIIDNKDMATKPAAVEDPTYIITAGDPSSKRSGITKRHVLYAVSAVLVIAIILVAILVGLYIFSKSQQEIVKFTLKFKGSSNDDINQEVISDPNDNVVMYHVTKEGQDTYIVNDFNRGMQIVKIATEAGTNCYITALNRSRAMEPSLITGNEEVKDHYKNDEAIFRVSADPVSDRSFLTKKAQDLCKGVSVYWVTKQCDKETKIINATDVQGDRIKRSVYNAGYFNGLPGLNGCCYTHFACSVTIYEQYSGGSYYCTVYISTGYCCGQVSTPYCNNYYKYYQATPGQYC